MDCGEVYAADRVRPERRDTYPFARTLFADANKDNSEGDELCGEVAVTETDARALHTIVTAMTNERRAGSAPAVEAEILALPALTFNAPLEDSASMITLSTAVTTGPLASMSFFPMMIYLLQQEKVDRNVIAMQVSG